MRFQAIRNFSRALLGAALIAATMPVPTAAPFSVELLQPGDQNVGNGYTLDLIRAATINDNRKWMVKSKQGSFFLVRDHSLWLTQGDAVGGTTAGFYGITGAPALNNNGQLGLRMLVRDQSPPDISTIAFNDQVVIQSGDPTTLPGFSPGTTYTSIYNMDMNDGNTVYFRATLDDPAFPGDLQWASVRLQLDAQGNHSSTTLLAREGDIPPGQSQPIEAFPSVAPYHWGRQINADGQILQRMRLLGSENTLIYLDDQLLLAEGQPSPIPGRNYLDVDGPFEINDLGDLAIGVTLDGATEDNQLIMLNERVLSQLGGSVPAIGGNHFDSLSRYSEIRIDNHRNVLWRASWADDQGTTVGRGLFLNQLLLVESGVTAPNGQPVVLAQEFYQTRDMSDSGRYILFPGHSPTVDWNLYVITMEAGNAGSVPDGKIVSGSPHGASRNGTMIDVSWDTSTCTAANYNLFYGNLTDVAHYGYDGEVCNLGTSGQASFAPPPGDLFWIIAPVDGEGIEGTHGFDGQGAPRNIWSGGRCGGPAQINSPTCVAP